MCLRDCDAEGLHLVEYARSEGGVRTGRLLGRHELLPDKGLEAEVEPTRRVGEQCELSRVQEVAKTVYEMATSLVKFDDGCPDGVDGTDVWVV